MILSKIFHRWSTSNSQRKKENKRIKDHLWIQSCPKGKGQTKRKVQTKIQQILLSSKSFSFGICCWILLDIICIYSQWLTTIGQPPDWIGPVFSFITFLWDLSIWKRQVLSFMIYRSDLQSQFPKWFHVRLWDLTFETWREKIEIIEA